MIVCSTHGSVALGFIGKAKQMAQHDAELLVRVRAAEFLGLIGAADPRPVIMGVLAQADDPIVALLALNTAVLLRDTKPGYAFGIRAKDVKAKHANITRRLEYFSPSR